MNIAEAEYRNLIASARAYAALAFQRACVGVMALTAAYGITQYVA